MGQVSKVERSSVLRASLLMSLVAAMLVTSSAGASASHYEDVPTSHPFHGQILWMVSEGITTGFPDGTFRPTVAVTRQAAAAFLYRLAGEPEVTSQAGFEDVPTEHPFHDEIAWMVDEGITTGFSDGTFRPTVPVTRQAAAAFLYRFEGQPPVSGVAGFSDVPTEQPFHDQIAWMVSEGITTGFPDDTFRPVNDVTRQAMAAFLHRYVHGEDPEAPEPEPDPESPVPPGESTFSGGTQVVGVDIAPGTYATSDTSQGCYWERLTGFSGELDDIITNEFTFDTTIVTIDASDVGFSSSGCGTWVPVQDTYPSSPTTTFGPGSFVVGLHIAPGTYVSGDTSQGCYWERLTGFSGELDDIITNEFTFDRTIVTIQPGDVGFSSSGCGQWARQ